MTYLTRRIGRAFSPGLATVALSLFLSPFLAGCSSPPNCGCGNPGVALIRVPATTSNPIVNVSAESPCTAEQSGSIYLWLTQHEIGICRGQVLLANGDVYAFSVDFHASDSGCCAGLGYPVDASVVELTDAGSGAGD